MKQIDFYFDLISPYSYLAFEQLPRALMGLSWHVTHIPIVLGALLKARGQRGPAEIEGKREWTYRQVLWQARESGIQMQMPASHPFNSLQLQRLAVACDAHGTPNRHVCDALFRHVWQGGGEASDRDRLASVTRDLAPARDPNGGEVKARLRAHTDAALARGVFGVPTFAVEDKLFWGFDALAMLRQHLTGDDWFGGPDWTAAADWPVGVTR